MLQEQLNISRTKSTLKLTLAALTCAIITTYGHMPLGSYSVLMVFVVMQSDPDTTLKKGLERAVGVTLAMGAALVLILLFHELKLLYLLSMMALTLVCMYLYAKPGFTSPYAALIGGIYGADLMLMSTDAADQAGTHAIHLLMQVLLAEIVIVLIQLNLWRPHPHAILRSAFGTILEDLAGRLSGLGERLRGAPPSQPAAAGVSLESFNHLLDLITLAGKGRKAFPEDMYLKAAAYCKNVFVKIGFLDQTLRSIQGLPSDEARAELTSALDGVAHQLRGLGQAFLGSDDAPPTSGPLPQAVAGLERSLSAMRPGTPPCDGLAWSAIWATLEGLLLECERLAKAYHAIQNKAAYAAFTQSKLPRRPEVEEQRAKRGSELDVEALKKSLKITLSALLVALGVIYVDLPGSTQALTSTMIIAAQPNLGKAYLKTKLRLMGIILGGLYSALMLIILAHLPHILVFILLLSLGFFVSAYFTYGSDRVDYAGRQAGMIQALVLLGTDGPPSSLDIADERLAGVIVGGAVALGVAHWLWPIDPLQQLKVKIAQAISQCGVIFTILVARPAGKTEEVKALVLALASTLPSITSLLKDASDVWRANPPHTEAWLGLIETLEGLYVDLATLYEALQADMEGSGIDHYLSSIAPTREGISACFKALAEQLNAPASHGQVIDFSALAAPWEGQKREEGVSVIAGGLKAIVYSLEKLSASVQRIANTEQAAVAP